jgi:excisionase family DNA binding protein
MEEKDMLTVQEVAGVLGIHQNSVYQAIQEGRLPVQEIFGRKVVNRADVEAYQQRTRIDGEKPKGRPKGSKKKDSANN